MKARMIFLIGTVALISGCTHSGSIAFQRGSAASSLADSSANPSTAEKIQSVSTEANPITMKRESDSTQSSQVMNAHLADVHPVGSRLTLASRDIDYQPLVELSSSGNLQDEIHSAPGDVLLDFHADWCGPCRTQGKVLSDFASAAKQRKLKIIKINVDAHPKVAQALGVSALPTLMLVRNGEIAQRRTGLTHQAELLSWTR